MQFLPATFTQYAVDGDHDGRPGVYDPADAIYTAAAMLCADGAAAGTPGGLSQAVFAYDHSRAYLADVFAWAARYTAPAAPGSTAGAAGTAGKAISFALAQLGKPYLWGATGPDAYDCSGLVYTAYASAGIHLARTTSGWRQDGPQIALASIQPGDLLFSAGADGTGANPGHVVMYLGGGQIIQAPQTGENVQTGPLDLTGVIAATRPAALAGGG
jgi:cell wall-associated NlpC family hydrolase